MRRAACKGCMIQTVHRRRRGERKITDGRVKTTKAIWRKDEMTGIRLQEPLTVHLGKERKRRRQERKEETERNNGERNK